MAHPEQIELTVGGRRFRGWTSLRVTRGIERCVADFDIGTMGRWAPQDLPWQILPFAPVELAVNGDLLVTGYVDSLAPTFGPDQHQLRITGRSKTQDLVDCTPDIAGGQYAGYPFEAICRAIAALFGIGVVVETTLAGSVVADATIERGETAFTFLERLGRMAGVLLTDNPAGELVLTTAGSTQASGALVQGKNILHAQGNINVAKRFSEYVVKAQHGLTPGATSVLTQQEATATDSAVPRFRPRVVLGETQMTQAQLQARANWMKQFAAGRATRATVTVQGWRQPDGSLWTPNQIVPVSSTLLGVDEDLLVAQVEFSLTAQAGSTTTLTVGPVAGYAPDPGQVRLYKAHGRKGHGAGSGIDWSGGGNAANAAGGIVR